MDRSFVERNDRNRERLRTLVDHLGDEELREPLGGGWTVAAALAHLAFWDGFALARLERFEQRGVFDSLPDGLADLLNAAGLPQWLALPPRRAADLAVEAAETVDRRIAALSPAAVEQAIATGGQRILDRSGHRGAHLDEIERRLID